MARNPTWAHDELILALELYLQHGQCDPTHPDVIAVSEILNALPIHTDRPEEAKFRNPNGVAMKTGNFRAIDPDDSAAGLKAGGQRDGEVWELFASRPDELRALAQEIRSGVTASVHFPETPEPGEDDVAEGRLVYRRHRSRERDEGIVRRKKAAVLMATGALACEVCKFDFQEFYGDWGAGYIECHHIVPLSESGETSTRLSDLVVLCSNCHRMAHRRKPWPTIDELRAVVPA